ncbi:MAG TPA: hypothetical protein VD886_07265 [Herpetosiphonaceae bacterium]|nr:hypothetical protein [Herpetosiphonaceae bacterium]
MQPIDSRAAGGAAMARLFADYFAHWTIALPPADVERRQRGHISAAGWSIHYLFGADERGEYLDFYATHRMTNERHERLYADGGSESLPAPLPFMVFPADASPEDRERIQQEYYAHNREVGALLRAKGFYG